MKVTTRKKKASEQRGRFKLLVYFRDHRLKRGFAMFSTVGQDHSGVSLKRFKDLVLQGKFAGQVRWAGIYEQGQEVWTFSR